MEKKPVKKKKTTKKPVKEKKQLIVYGVEVKPVVKDPKKRVVTSTLGAPRKIKNVKQLIEAWQEYYDSCFIWDVDAKGNEYKRNITPLSVLGFCCHLNILRTTLIEWENTREDLSDTIKTIKGTIELWVEGQLYTNNRTVGIIFSLKNNFKENWADTQQQEIKITDNKIKFNFGIDETEE